MAKKRENLTFEERLEKALVPDWEQSYKVPSNWVWTRLEFLGVFGMGQTILSKNLVESGVPVYSATEEDKIFGYIPEEENKINLEHQDLVIPARGNSIGHVKYITEQSASCTQTTMYFKPYNKKVSKLLYYYMKCNKDVLFQYSGNAIPQITISNIILKSVPLPPLAEQQRIVDRIESLFSKLDEAKEKAQTALDSFENRKDAILHKAFSGELTQKWREENGVNLDSWVEVMSGNIFSYVTSGSRGWAQYYSDKGAMFIRMGNLNHGTIKIDLSDVQYVSLPDKAEGQRSLVQKDDILISITADVGMVGVIEEDGAEAYINQHVALARPIKTVNSQFIAWFLVSDLGLGQLRALQRGATKKGLSLQDIKSLKIRLPKIKEQFEVVRILDKIFEKETQAKEIVTVIKKIDLMKKAILARAFRGELGTNSLKEESAMELLNEILSTENKKEQRHNKKSITIPNSISKQFKTDLEEQIYRVIIENQNSTLNKILSCISSSKHLDAMEVLTLLYEKGLIDKKNELYFTK